ncbi:MAG TPA: HAMP domain-containing sensor histidine kinase [Streptosporangiaceae bacterium]|nr:HAMP domain-containing sensor histidine kinase [Streptosporangiaceae bacterium]
MTSSGRLSLRARLLVLLISVTAAFLLIMGAVSTFVLSKRLGHQFNAELVAAAQRSPQQIASNPGDYVAVEVTIFPVQVRPLTGNSAATRELTAAVDNLIARHTARDHVDGQPFAVDRATGPRMRAVARLMPASAGRGTGAVLFVARPVGTVTAQVGGIVIVELITGGALLLLLAVSGRWLIGRGLAPLGQMASTAHRITSRGDLTARMPDADDSTEVGRLGWAINTMLDRIQQAFGARLQSEQKVRQFAADASHELRTPLTTIRGYAELYHQGALGPDQLPNAMRRIEQEAQRMSTLVAELLELARLDRTSSLDLAETDLAGLVRDAAADAAAVEPDRPVKAEAPDRLIAVVDEARIRQVLANLLGNVREHTPPGTPTAVRLAPVRGAAVLEVADAGPGMSEQDAARAFDRFHRGSDRPGSSGQAGDGAAPGNGAGSPRRGGSGLGLSIVQAIAVAHGGQAVLESWPGQGTRVRVWLPTGGSG